MRRRGSPGLHSVKREYSLTPAVIIVSKLWFSLAVFRFLMLSVVLSLIFPLTFFTLDA